ncbi:hypothetical protein T4B_8416 [Trichinella pseudospiralis]|uniref:Uncharacterized protein n=1 Tax=Trichinella pseudospiralis TaxID=6337 RepID=A0A0V1IEV1_TRIPS|nr:hypothetical protein T4B_8416 [Trichinella pseudospiralis]
MTKLQKRNINKTSKHQHNISVRISNKEVIFCNSQLTDKVQKSGIQFNLIQIVENCLLANGYIMCSNYPYTVYFGIRYLRKRYLASKTRVGIKSNITVESYTSGRCRFN